MKVPKPSAAVWARYAGYATGVTLIGIGVAGLLRDAADTAPLSWAMWFAGGVSVHDLLFVPAVLAGAMLLGRVPMRAPWRAAAQAGLLVAGSVALVSLPLVLGYGRKAANPSILPLDYPRNLLVVVALIIAAVTTVALVTTQGRRLGRAWRRLRRSRLWLRR